MLGQMAGVTTEKGLSSRGERGGNFRGKGEGFTRKSIKETWTKTGGGGNGRELGRAEGGLRWE